MVLPTAQPYWGRARPVWVTIPGAACPVDVGTGLADRKGPRIPGPKENRDCSDPSRGSGADRALICLNCQNQARTEVLFKLILINFEQTSSLQSWKLKEMEIARNSSPTIGNSAHEGDFTQIEFGH